jgi:hypothetical protein
MVFWRKIRIKIQIVITLLLWCYILYRAFFISITQDEAHTYLLVKTNNWKQALGTTNTHWLNSFFIKFFLWLPGEDHLWKIRMFSVLSWIIYSFSIIRLSSYFKSQWFGFVFFIVAALNPFLIFYFSLARGYAPACAFIMLSLWLATKCVQANKIEPRKWFYVFLAAAAATLANFATFYLFIGLVCAFLLQLLINKKLNLIFHASARPWMILVSGISIITAGALFLIRGLDNLWFPGKSNLVNSLFGSLVQSLSYFDNDSAVYYTSYHNQGATFLLNEEVFKTYQAAGVIIALLLAVAILYSVFLFSRTKRLSLSSLALFSCLAVILFNVFFNLFFKTPYLFSRTTLILYPPLVLGLFTFIDRITLNSLRVRRIISGFLGLLVIFFGYNYYKSFSSDSFSDWPIQTNTKECLDYLQASNAKRIGISEWHYSVFTNYYSKAYPGRYTFSYRVLSEKEQVDSLDTSLPSQFDYLLLVPPYNDSALLKAWSIKLSFSESGSKVVKNDSMSISGNRNSLIY